MRPHLFLRNSSHVVRTHEAYRGSKEQREDEEEATRAASCANVSLQRVKESRWQHRQERKDAVSGQTDGKHQADNRVTGARGGKKEEDSTVFRNTCGGKRQWCLGSEEPTVPSHAWQHDVKASVDNTWQISRNQRLSRKKSSRVSSGGHNEETWLTRHRHRKRD